MRAVAAAVGVTPPSIYLHFADKQALVTAVVDQQWGEFHDVLVSAAREADGPFDALRCFCLAYLRFAEEKPGRYRLLLSAAEPTPQTAVPLSHPGMHTFEALTEIVQRCLDHGAAPRADRDSWFLALQIWLSGHGLVDLRLGRRFPFPFPPPEELLDAVLSDLGLQSSVPGTPGGHGEGAVHRPGRANTVE